MIPLEEAGAVFVFSPTTATWRKVVPTSGKHPQARSYHCATATADTILVHAGCGNAEVGRLNDLWSFDPKAAIWKKLADAPGDPRGGSAIAHCANSNKVWRFGGFNGKTEVGGVIDYLDLTPGLRDAQWQSITFADDAVAPGREDASSLAKSSAYPGARSVTGLHVLAEGQLITFFGEGKPSPTGGHDAAGNFWGDIWLFNPATRTWTEVEQQGEGPGERGWFGSDTYHNGVVVWGGLNGQNERIADGWVLKLE